MAEPDDDGGTNIWAPNPSYPRQRPSADGEPISASARALLEGWPEQPGWVPEGGLGGAWGEAPVQHGTAQAYTPPPTSPATYAATPPGGWQPEPQYPGTSPAGTGTQFPPGYPGGGAPTPAPYPGPPAPLPRSNNGVIVAAAIAVIVAIAAGAGAVVYTQRDRTPTTDVVATTSTAPSAGTSSAPSTTGGSGTTPSTTGSSGSSSSSGSSGSSGASGSSGSSSSTPSNLPTAGTDFTTLTLPSDVASPQNAAVAQTLDAYFTGINGSDYENAYSQLSSGQQAKNPYDGFVTATSGTIDSDVTVTAVDIRNDRTARASVTFTSRQPGDKGAHPGETCTNWSLRYTLVPGSGAGGYLISDSSGQHSPC